MSITDWINLAVAVTTLCGAISVVVVAQLQRSDWKREQAQREEHITKTAENYLQFKEIAEGSLLQQERSSKTWVVGLGILMVIVIVYNQIERSLTSRARVV